MTLPPGSPGTFSFTGDIEGTLEPGETAFAPGIVGNPAGVVTQADPSDQGFELASIVCDDSGSVTPSEPDLGTGTVTFRLDELEIVECVFTNGPPSAIFSDGFESGDTSAWSSQVGG